MIMRKAALVYALLSAIGTSLPATAHADPVQIGLAITVTSTTGNAADIFGVSLPVGSVFSGLLTFDPNSRDTAAEPATGSYPLAGTVRLDVGSALMTGISITVSDGTSTPDLFTAEGEPSIPGFYPRGQLFVHFVAPASAIHTDHLPQSEAEFLAAFRSGILFLGVNKLGQGGSRVRLSLSRADRTHAGQCRHTRTGVAAAAGDGPCWHRPCGETPTPG